MIVVEVVRIFFEIVLTLAVCGLVIVGASFLLLIAINIVELVTGSRWRTPLPPANIPDRDLPDVLVQIPVFNEPEMVADALRAAATLDWPKDKLHIQFSMTAPTIPRRSPTSRPDNCAAQGFDILHLRREDRSGFKAGALAAGLAQSDAPIIAMLDVDFRPPRELAAGRACRICSPIRAPASCNRAANSPITGRIG